LAKKATVGNYKVLLRREKEVVTSYITVLEFITMLDFIHHSNHPKQCMLNLRFRFVVMTFQLSIVASRHNGPPSRSTSSMISSKRTNSSSTVMRVL
jgi:hypothetical protein